MIAVEPAPETHTLLLENLRINGAGTVEVHALAIGGESEVRRLLYSKGGAVMNRTVEADAASGGAVVSALGLGEFFRLANIDRCDYLKIDCEGGEYDILLPATDAVLQCVRYLCLEYHDGIVVHSHQVLLARLQSAEFSVQVRENPVDASQGWIFAQQRNEDMSCSVGRSGTLS